MGRPLMCVLGFPITRANAFSERLERYTAAMDASYRDGYYQLLLALASSHAAVDAALADDASRCEERMAASLAQLTACNDELTALGEGLVRLRTELFEQEGVDPDDPLIAREPFFATLDTEVIHRELAAHGAAVPQRAFWDEVASRVRDGGAHAGLRLLDRHVRELQSDLRVFVAEIEVMRRLPGRAFAEALHGCSRGISTLLVGFTRLVTTFTYFSILCERASQAHERSLAGVELVAAAS